MNKYLHCIILLFLYLVYLPSQAQTKPDLGTAISFTVLANTGIINNNLTEIRGNAGVYPGMTFSGFPPGVIKGKKEVGTLTAAKAQEDLVKAYTGLQTQTPTQTLTDGNLKGKTFSPGVYKINGAATLSGDLTLNNGGNTNGVFIFQISGALTIDRISTIKLSETAKPLIQNIFWLVEGGVTIGEGSTFRGSVLAQNNIVVQDGALIQGRLLTTNGQVTLDENQITFPTDLSVSLAKSPGSVSTDVYLVNETITYTVTAQNLGPIEESNVRIKDLLPAGLTYISSRASVAAYDPATATWIIPNLPSGATETLVIEAKFNASATDFVFNSATIAGDGLDEIVTNNSALISNVCVAPVSPGTISGPKTICLNSSGNVFSVEPISNVRRYNWVVSGGLTIESGQNTSSIKVKAGRSAGTGTVSLTVENVCAYSNPVKKSVTIITPLSTAPGTITASTPKPCAGETGLTYSIAAVAGADSYVWSVPAGWEITSGQGTTTITAKAGAAGGNITAKAVNECGESPVSAKAVAPSTTVPAAPTKIVGDFNPCAGQVTEYSVPNDNNAVSYNWVVPAGWSITAGQGTNTIQVKVGPSAGNIQVSGVNNCGTGPAISQQYVPATITALATPAAIAGSKKVCSGETGIAYSIAPVEGATAYTWVVPADWVIENGQGSTAIKVKAGKTAGNVEVKASNSCGTSAARTLAVTIEPGAPNTPEAITGPAFVCSTTTGITYSIAPVSRATVYTWIVPAGWTIVSGQGTVSVEVNAAAAAGEISVTAKNDCGTSQKQAILIKTSQAPPAQTGKITGISSVCINQSGLTYSVPAVATAEFYDWTLPTGWEITSGQGTTTIKVKAGSIAATDEITVKAVNSCGAGPAQTLVVSASAAAPAAPTTITGAAQVCAGQKEVVYSVKEVDGANSYTWTVPTGWTITTGQGKASITLNVGTTTGNIGVSVTNGCGTSKPTLLAVSIIPKPAAPAAISGPANVCEGSSNNTYRIQTVPDATSYIWTVPEDWKVNSGQGTTTLNVSAGKASGEISVVAVNACNNSKPATLPVTAVGAFPNAIGPISIEQKAVCQGQSGLKVSISAVAAASSYEWQVPTGWTITSGLGTTSITVTAGTNGGTIAVKAKNTCGESKASTLAVALLSNTPLTIGTIAGEVVVCSGRSDLVYTIPTVTGATSYSWTVPEGWMISAGQGTASVKVKAGTKSGVVSVVASNNCANSHKASLSINTTITPAAPASIKDLSNACKGLVYVADDKDNIGADYTPEYIWTVPAGWTINSGQGTREISVSAPVGSLKSNISVVVSNQNCSSPAATLVADPALSGTEIIIPNVFSPNGDGTNDKWEITGLPNYPDNELSVINRWGNEVYRSKTYQNNWSGSELNAGTYYYVLKVKVCDGGYQTYKGYVMIMR